MSSVYNSQFLSPNRHVQLRLDLQNNKYIVSLNLIITSNMYIPHIFESKKNRYTYID